MEQLNIELHGYGTQTVFLELTTPEGEAFVPEADKLDLWVKPPFQNKFRPLVRLNGADADAGLGVHLAVTFASAQLQNTHWREARWALDLADEHGGFTTLIGGTVRRSY